MMTKKIPTRHGKIYLSINNREEIMELPVVPPEIEVQSPWGIETYNTNTQGDITLIGKRGLETLLISSFFPVHDYPFVQFRGRPGESIRMLQLKGWEYVNKLNQWRDRRIPIRFILTAIKESNSFDIINNAYVIEGFNYGPKDGSGDIYYTMLLKEFKFIKLPKRRV